MIARAVTRVSALRTGVDRRVWLIVALVGFFSVIMMKEVSLPSSAIAVFGALGLLGLFMFGVKSPELPFYVLVAYLPFSREFVGDVGTEATALNLTNILIAWAFLTHAACRMSRRE